MTKETLNTARKSVVLPIALYPWGGDYRPAAAISFGQIPDSKTGHYLLYGHSHTGGSELLHNIQFDADYFY